VLPPRPLPLLLLLALLLVLGVWRLTAPLLPVAAGLPHGIRCCSCCWAARERLACRDSVCCCRDARDDLCKHQQG
jgi:hypothetical protein